MHCLSVKGQDCSALYYALFSCILTHTISSITAHCVFNTHHHDRPKLTKMGTRGPPLAVGCWRPVRPPDAGWAERRRWEGNRSLTLSLSLPTPAPCGPQKFKIARGAAAEPTGAGQGAGGGVPRPPPPSAPLGAGTGRHPPPPPLPPPQSSEASQPSRCRR